MRHPHQSKYFALSLMILCFGFITVFASPPAENESTIKIPAKGSDDKFIYLSDVGLYIDHAEGMQLLSLYLTKSDKDVKIDTKMDEAEKKMATYAANADKSKKSTKEQLKSDEDDNVIEKNTTLGNALYTALKGAGFIDTVNRVFADENNTIVLSAKISKIHIFAVSGYKDNPCCNSCYKSKVYLKWYVKNRYGEILDSLVTFGISDNVFRDDYAYRIADVPTKKMEKVVQSGVEASFLKLYHSEVFKRHLSIETIGAPTDALLHLNKPEHLVAEKSDAASASVIVKRADKGHGSGFAVTEDGYIITNYHVLASDNPAKPEKLKVVTGEGEELEATIVRFSKARDLALLKVNKKFEKAFAFSSEKLFKKLMDVYTIGAPKSIELGQSMSSGLISNERKANNNELLQLSMPVNFGNSGGPLFDKTGILHGVIVSKLVGESTEGISFAIPAYKIGEYLNIAY